MDAAQVDKLLREKGFMTRRDWAVAQGHNPHTVNTTFRRWLGCERDTVPRGEGARILTDLKQTLNQDVLSVAQPQHVA